MCVVDACDSLHGKHLQGVDAVYVATMHVLARIDVFGGQAIFLVAIAAIVDGAT
jgi:hypothetical protein